jgi:very-short-patch-repair endonuclease
MTDAERALWRVLRTYKDKGFHFRRQVPLGSYIADFVCHSAKLVIEVDGGQHGTEAGIVADEARTAWLEGQGYRVTRFWNNDVLGNIEGVTQLIDAALESGKEES